MSIFYLHIQCIGYADSTDAPIFSLPEGQYYNVQSKDVSISCGTIGATIYYTTDGSNPTTSSLVYTTTLTLSKPTILKSMAVKSGSTISTITTAVYYIGQFPENIKTLPLVSDYTWDYTYPTNASMIYVTFSSDTYSNNSMYLYDANDNYIGYYTWNQLAGKRIAVNGNRIKIKLIAYCSSTNYFKVTSITDKAVSAPTFSLPEGGYYNVSSKQVSILCDTSGATIHYTNDGSIPSATSPVYNAPITLTQNTVLKAFAVKDGLPYSEVQTATYYIGMYPESFHPFESWDNTSWEYTYPTNASKIYVTFSPETLMYIGHLYLYDGSDNLISSYQSTELAGKRVEIPGNKIKIVMEGSHFGYGFKIDSIGESIVQKPVISLPEGQYFNVTAKDIDISCATSGATIYYTTDGSDPTISSPTFTNSLSLKGNFTLKAKAIKSGMNDSDISTSAYYIGMYPESSHPHYLETDTNLTYTYPTNANKIYVSFSEQTNTPMGLYLYDGNDNIIKNGTSNYFNGTELAGKRIEVNGNTLKIRLPWCTASDVYGFKIDYITDIVPASPVISLPQGQYYNDTSRQITITSQQSGGTIYYTTDGKNPTKQSTLYTGPITLTQNTILKAISVKSGTYDSGIAVATYYIGMYPECFHPVSEAMDYTWDYTYPTNAENIYVTFSPNTYVVYGSAQRIYLYDGNDKLIKNRYQDFFDGNSLSGKRITVAGNRIKIRLSITGNSGSAYGFKIDNITDTTVGLPSFVPQERQFYNTSSRQVSITSSTTGATIYYTTNGTDPTTSSSIYTGPITLTQPTIIKAKALKTGIPESDISTATYFIGQFPESIHPYETTDYTWDYTYPTNANSIYVTFSQETSLDYGDKIYIYDGNDNLVPAGVADEYGDIQDYYGRTKLAGKRIAIPGNRIKIKLVSSESYYNEYYGFKITDIVDSIVSPPVFSLDGGQYYGASSKQVSISCSTEGASIYYTIDGSIPTQSSSLYTRPLTLNTSTIIKAISIKPGSPNSNITTATYYIGIYPESTHPFNDYNFQAKWEYKYSTNKDKIYVTFANEMLSNGSTGFCLMDENDNIIKNGSIDYFVGSDLAGKRITVNGSTIKIRLYSYSSSHGNEYGFKITNITDSIVDNPTFSIPGGQFYGETSKQVSISCLDNQATIYYTIDGSKPTSSSTKYIIPLIISQNTLVKAIAIKNGVPDSEIVEAVFYLSQYPESLHTYDNKMDYTWDYTYKSSLKGMQVTFSSDTYVENRYDKIFIYDGNNNIIMNGTKDYFTGWQLADKTIIICGNRVKIRLWSDELTNDYGFRVVNIQPYNTDLITTSTPQFTLLSPTSGEVSVDITRNLYSTLTNSVVVAALYNKSGVLVSLSNCSVNIGTGNPETATNTIVIPTNPTGCKLKLMFWNDVISMNPLCDPLIYNVDNVGQFIIE